MRNPFINLYLAFMTFGTVFGTVIAHATPIVYNAVTDFSISKGNANGVWTYGYGTPGSTFTPDTVSGAAFSGFSGFAYWGPANNGLPLVGLNSNSTPTSGFTPFPPSSDLWMHPGDDDSLAAILRFTAPTSGNYNLAGLFERVDQDNGQGNGVFVSIYKNNTVLQSPTFISNSEYGNSVSFDSTVFLTAGDSLNFDLARNGQYNFDSTGLQLEITAASVSPAPEPSSLALFGTGTFGIAIAVRRRFFNR
jgi:hypothetical protein